MKTLVFSCIILFIFVGSALAQDSKVIDTEIKVHGNCGMCKDRIEQAVDIKEVKYAKWDKNSKMLRVAFEATVSADSLQKRIAAVGHDTDKYKADNEVYSALPKCCLYRDNAKTH
ncbi:MAG: hypothetical protein K9I69_08265 [Ignavibacteriales bacterium]|nr:hypothetical protein [Ignavibacteriales bacterium]MCF8306659.1 hypothetical protein [Ignavibacteriales bacterium]MCF8316241.1 hypothetical protein [Ignavibacteriales bacterium]MCF8437825.1 hypothetical protein [Ignavibacteriales bacterium]